MKKGYLIISIVLFLLAFGMGAALLADDTVEMPSESVVVATESPVVAEEETSDALSLGDNVWAFLNSSLGISIVAFLLSFILGKIFTAKPKWKQLIIKHGPKLMQAVKVAEKAIPNNAKNKSLSRLDEALKCLVELEPKLKKVADGALKEALTAVHASAEKNGNLKKE